MVDKAAMGRMFSLSTSVSPALIFAQDKIQPLVVVNTALNLRVP
jgi:hypothetical protein